MEVKLSKIFIVVLSLFVISCASTNELIAPCTYDDRAGCGELIYSNGVV